MGIRVRLSFGLTVGFCLIFFAVADLQAAPRQPSDISVDVFGALPEIMNARLSPNGKQIAYISADDDRLGISVMPRGASDRARAVKLPIDGDVLWVQWANDARLLAGINLTYARDDTAGAETRLLSLPLRGGKSVVLDDRPVGLTTDTQFQPNIIDTLYRDPEHVLIEMETDGKKGFSVYKVNIFDGERTRVEKGNSKTVQWITDSDGAVRMRIDLDDTKTKVSMRRESRSRWREIIDFDVLKDPSFAPLSFSASKRGRIYILSNRNGRQAVFEYNTQRKKFGDELYSHPVVDLEGIITGQPKDRIIGYTYVVDTPTFEFVDERRSSMARSVNALLLGTSNAIVSSSNDGRYHIIRSSGPQHAPLFHTWDAKAVRLDRFAESYPELSAGVLSPVIPMSYRARDGLRIRGYLTLPRGARYPTRTDRKWPLVVLPHGGPSARDVVTFDFMSQFFASRGWAVFQMNFRGSTGYGRAFEEAGFKQWGQAMQNDITDGVRYLIAESFADPDRICVVGASYGGYAALMGAVKTPDLYQCAVSIAGVSDVHAYVTSLKSSRTYALNAPRIGDPVDDEEMLKEHSPLYRADEIKIPVLLLHGTLDETVKVSQSEQMAARLSAAGKNYRYVPLVDGDHYLRREGHRVTILKEAEALLKEHMN